MKVRAVGALGIAVVAVLACSPFASDESTPSPTTSNGGSEEDAGATALTDGGTGAGTDAATDGAAPSGMVLVAAVDGRRFWVDATEVTVGDFKDLVNAHPVWTGEATKDIPECSAKAAWGPKFNCVAVTHEASEPMNCVDWCDAKAYCNAVGKRLCGRVGGGAVPSDMGLDPKVDQWTRACRGNADQEQPYGNTYIDGGCNTNAPDGKPAAVKTFADCLGGWPGLFDMAGNLNEWEDLCFPDAGTCAVRGGAFPAIPENTGCAHVHSASMKSSYPDVGFRCCLDVP